MVDMFCILKCPKCENIQGSRYPIKRTKCTLCGTSIDVDRMSGMKLFDSHDDMLITIQAIKMKSNDIKCISTTGSGPVYQRKKPVNRSYIRDLILRSTIEIISEKDLFEIMNHSGIEESTVEVEVDNLILSGDIFRPKGGFLKKVDP